MKEPSEMLAASRNRLFVGGLFARRSAGRNEELYRQLQVLGDVLEKARSNYVENPDDAKLIGGAINGMLQALDPHSWVRIDPGILFDMGCLLAGAGGNRHWFRESSARMHPNQIFQQV